MVQGWSEFVIVYVWISTHNCKHDSLTPIHTHATSMQTSHKCAHTHTHTPNIPLLVTHASQKVTKLLKWNLFPLFLRFFRSCMILSWWFLHETAAFYTGQCTTWSLSEVSQYVLMVISAHVVDVHPCTHSLTSWQSLWVKTMNLKQLTALYSYN